ncbi:hypothetical protein CAPTEDRAFT_205589 [Capitella teleta]|uniref:Uncharacterized protein n=1 Tax=Capitella teleta TaxID=283909 RepID=R7TXL2_CAPTE|nr:hypothetical protein CAPTEDRAFT_205589 [Capitella teleta]|eukprot:ELT98474.1 hypothetical protein CAPTEDRAFT_205589 [Capitella teleta]
MDDRDLERVMRCVIDTKQPVNIQTHSHCIRCELKLWKIAQSLNFSRNGVLLQPHSTEFILHVLPIPCLRVERFETDLKQRSPALGDDAECRSVAALPKRKFYESSSDDGDEMTPLRKTRNSIANSGSARSVSQKPELQRMLRKSPEPSTHSWIGDALGVIMTPIRKLFTFQY